MAFIERREKLEGDKKAIGDDIKVVNAEIAAAGFDLKTMNAVMKIRKAKPHDYQEAQALLDTYLHALGMASEPPLARFTKNAAVDKASLDSIVEYMSPAVPASGGGHIDIVFGKSTWRLTRDLFGLVTRQEVTASAPQREPASERSGKSFERPPVPSVDEAGARDLGKQYAAQNRPVIDNPFPFGDPRRARFDEGWREGAGGDGMGPPEE
jgi:uncharacterized protein (UPF0335 family)